MASEKKKADMHIRMTNDQKQRLVLLARGSGFNSYSEYVRFTLLNPSFDMKLNRVIEILKGIRERLDA